MSVQLYVSCYKGEGASRYHADAGVHATYPDRAMAERDAPQEIRWLRQCGYSEVLWNLIEEEEKGS